MWVLLLLLLISNYKVYAQEPMVLSGIVKSADGTPLEGVTVWQNDSNNGTQTNEQGFYSLNIVPNVTITFEYLGFKTQHLKASTNVLNVTMQTDDDTLEELVINAGYYSVTDKERTGSISKITSKEIGQQPVANPLAAMQGRMAGVNITQSSGTPGGGFDIQIRGRNSLRTEGNAPLYIVDGVPYLSESTSHSYLSAGSLKSTENNPLQLINPNDIESIEVLKDADATAIYGSRGANGVVLITTKKGVEQATVFTLQSHTAVGVVPKFMKMLGTADYLELRKRAYANDGITEYPAAAHDVNGNWDPERYTDWQKELIGGKAVTQQVSANVRGGSKNSQFMIMGSIAKDGTVFPGEYGNKRNNLLAQFAHTTPGEKWKIQTQFVRGESNNSLLGTDLTRDALTLAPNAPSLYDDEGNLNWEKSTWDNPLRWINETYRSKSMQWLTAWNIEGSITKGLVFKLQAGYNETVGEEQRLSPHTIYDPSWGLTSAYSNSMRNSSSGNNWNIEPQLHFDKTWKKHKISVLAGSTFLKQEKKQHVWRASDFSSNSQITNLAAAKTLQIVSSLNNKYAYQALFSRLNYQYNDKYIVNLTARRDGSSRFGPNRRWANFGAVAGAWLFSREKLFEESSWLSFGKLRASYGSAGNDRIGDYQYMDTYGYSGGMYEVGGLRPLRLYNPDFSWETNIKKEVALEFALFRNRFNASAAYYENKSSDQLVGIPLPGTTGFNSIQANLPATVRNSGWEFEMNAKLLTSTNWNLSVFGNISFNENKLIEFPGLKESTYKYTYALNYPTSMKFAYEFTGVDEETGMYTFRDFNGDGKITANEDMQLIVQTAPKYFAGFGQDISYKNWSLNVLFQAVKQTAPNYQMGWGMPGMMSNQPQGYDKSPIQKPSTGADAQVFQNYNIYMQSQAAYSDASFIRLKNIVLNYSLPAFKASRLKGYIYISGQNVLTITKYRGLDPESQSNVSVPPLKVWSLGATFSY
ncbi:MAG: SusC/RagA family TonB-linked outer membrane protein [Myroides sp.]|nr:SusC/RagA family TonB-linked outer membrane protein [Myroides sp.]